MRDLMEKRQLRRGRGARAAGQWGWACRVRRAEAVPGAGVTHAGPGRPGGGDGAFVTSSPHLGSPSLPPLSCCPLLADFEGLLPSGRGMEGPSAPVLHDTSVEGAAVGQCTVGWEVPCRSQAASGPVLWSSQPSLRYPLGGRSHGLGWFCVHSGVA